MLLFFSKYDWLKTILKLLNGIAYLLFAEPARYYNARQQNYLQYRYDVKCSTSVLQLNFCFVLNPAIEMEYRRGRKPALVVR